MYGEQKVWQKPELTVLVRSKSEEAVLQACKTEGVGFFPASPACAPLFFPEFRCSELVST